MPQVLMRDFIFHHSPCSDAPILAAQNEKQMKKNSFCSHCSLISGEYAESIQGEQPGNGVKKMNVCALIPSYDPDERLVSTVKDLQSAGFRHIIVVDDGSRPDCQPYFDALKPLACLVVHLPQNSGKGDALKMGFLTFLT